MSFIFVLIFSIVEIADHQQLIEQANQILREIFQLQDFLPEQLAVIIQLIRGVCTYTVSPTGYGISLIYQIAAKMSPHKLTVVFSSLIALLQDTNIKFKNLGVRNSFLFIFGIFSFGQNLMNFSYVIYRYCVSYYMVPFQNI